MKCALWLVYWQTWQTCERNSDDGSLKTNKATNILCSFKTHLKKGGGGDKNQRRNSVKGAPLIQKRTCFYAGG